MRHRSCLSIVVASLSGLVLASLSHADMLPGAQVRKWPPNPDRHQIKIERTAANDTGRKMIATAEAAYPEDKKKEKVWWQGEQLGLKLPFAITKDAVDYYKARVASFGKKEWERYIEPSSKLNYEAAVSWNETFKTGDKTYEKVFVVLLKLHFSANFTLGTTESLMFEKERKVILDRNGKVLAIEGDGPTVVPVAVI